MADVQPLKTLRYDPAAAGPLGDLIAPPYDVIDERMRAQLAGRRPYNVVGIDLPASYDGAAARRVAQAGRAGPGERAGHVGAPPGLHRPRRLRAHPDRLLRARARGGL